MQYRKLFINNKAKWLTVVLCFGLQLLCAQRYNFITYSTAQGMGSNSVNHIFQDSKGYIWFATQGGGVSRFNGKDFVNFTKTEGLVNNDVTYLTEDAQNNIWIATAAGVSVYNGQGFTNYTGANGFCPGVTYAIAADSHNKLWFATKDSGVYVYDGKKFHHVSALGISLPGEAYSVIADKQGRMYVGSYGGVFSYQNGKTINHFPETEYNEKTFFSAFCAKNGTVWMGTTDGTVVYITSSGTKGRLTLPQSVANDFIGSISEDANGHLWFSTDHGLLKYTPAGREFKLFSEMQGISANTVQAVMVDYENNLWIGTLNGGVNLLQSEALIHYAEKEGLLSKNVTAISPMPADKGYYIGTGSGLYSFTENQLAKENTASDINTANITSLATDAQNQLWITAQEGIYVVKHQNGKWLKPVHYTHLAQKRLISPQKVIHDRKGNTWIATYGSGLFRYQNSQTTTYNTTNGLPTDNLLTLFEDAQGTIWVGTQDAGLLKQSGERFVPVTYVKDNAIWSIAQAQDGTLFFGTGESGLWIMRSGELLNLRTGNGLQANFLPAIAWQQNTNGLWLGTEKGLQLLQFDNRYRIKGTRIMGLTQGFKTTSVSTHAIQCTPQNNVWLGTANGLWIYDPAQDKSISTPPKIQLTGVKLFYGRDSLQPYCRSIDALTGLPELLKLPYTKNHLTFHVQALTTSGVTYMAKLQGQDMEWSSPGANNVFTYSNITPGNTYTFLAKAIVDDTGKESPVVSFTFQVAPPWYNTWWFRISALSLLALGLYAYIRWREQKLQRDKKQLEETVYQRTQKIEEQKKALETALNEKEVLLKEIHHRVKNNLQTISSMLMLQSAGLKDEEARKAIRESQARVRSIALVHQKLYQNEGLEKVELKAFLNDLTEQIRSLYKDQQSMVTISIQSADITLLIDAAIPLGLIINELLTNSFKYAFADVHNPHIAINASLHTITDEGNPKQRLLLTYTDNGPGLPDPQLVNQSPTLGLRLIRLLSAQIGAQYSYSNTNQGIFTFTIPLNL